VIHIIVCVKEIPDPEIPPEKFRIDPDAKRVIPPQGIIPVINPYDERAVELALRLKEKHRGKITVLTLGIPSSVKVVKHALSMGADEGVVLADQEFDGSDSFGIAHILTKAIQKIGNYDLILCGRQAADWDEGLVGSIIAENLSLPLVTLVQAIELIEKSLRVNRVSLDGYQIFSVPMPAIATVSNEVGRPRLPSGLGIISAARKQVPIWTARDIDPDPSRIGAGAVRRKLVKLFIPERKSQCEVIRGESAAEAAVKLAKRLRESKVI
jgi:electron transfer flavoprotein beta subunit